MRTIVRGSLVASLFLTLCLSALTFATPAQAASKRISVSHQNPAHGQTVSITGRVGTNVKRTIKLQRHTGKKWATVKTTKTRGSFKFTRKALNTRYAYRVYAPQVQAKVKGKKRKKTYRPVKTATVRIQGKKSPPPVVAPPTSAEIMAAETSLRVYIAQARAAHSTKPAYWNRASYFPQVACLDAFDRMHSNWMSDNQTVEHSADGTSTSDPRQSMSQACPAVEGSENIVGIGDQTTPSGAAKSAVEWWMGSSGHRDALLSKCIDAPNYYLGVGAARDSHGVWFFTMTSATDAGRWTYSPGC